MKRLIASLLAVSMVSCGAVSPAYAKFGGARSVSISRPSMVRTVPTPRPSAPAVPKVQAAPAAKGAAVGAAAGAAGATAGASAAASSSTSMWAWLIPILTLGIVSSNDED